MKAKLVFCLLAVLSLTLVAAHATPTKVAAAAPPACAWEAAAAAVQTPAPALSVVFGPSSSVDDGPASSAKECAKFCALVHCTEGNVCGLYVESGKTLCGCHKESVGSD